MGWLDGSLYLADRVLRKASGGSARIVKYYLVAQPIGRVDAKPMRSDPATVLCKVAKGDALVASFPRPAEILTRRFEAGATCTAALVQGEFAGFIWLQRSRYDEDEVRCTYVLEVPAVSVWDFDVYVEPRYRVGRTMARLWSHVDAELAADGVRWSFSRISAFNVASLASHTRLGAARRASVLFLAVGRWQLAVMPRFPFVHFSASERLVPVVRLRPPA
jgi:hypothetical protein